MAGDITSEAFDNWRNSPYPLVWGSGAVERIPCLAVSSNYPVIPSYVYFVVCDGWLPSSANVYVEQYDDETKTFYEITSTYLYDDDGNSGAGLLFKEDGAGKHVTMLRIRYTQLFNSYGTSVYASVEWTPRSTDTIGNAVMDIMTRAEVPLAVDPGIGDHIDQSVGDISFDVMINEQQSPLGILGDRILPQLMGCLRFDRDSLGVWMLPRTLESAGPHLREDVEIVDVAVPPACTASDKLANAFWARFQRNMGRNGERYTGVLNINEIDVPVKLSGGGSVALRTEDYDVPASSRRQFGSRRLDYEAPDLTDENDVRGILDRIARWFAFPAMTMTLRLSQDQIYLRAGQTVRVTHSVWGFDETPFIIQSMTPDKENPTVTLWGGRQI